MGSQLREYKRRIKSVGAIKKMTKAMEMIAASRIIKAQRQVNASTPYATALTDAVTAVAHGTDVKHPLTTEAERPRRAAVLVLTSDRGQAGAYSANAIKAGEHLISQLVSEGKEVDTYVVGRKGVSYFSFRERPVVESWTGFTDNPQYADAKRVAAPLIEAVGRDSADGGVDELHIAFTQFVSMMTQTPVEQRMLPLTFDKSAKESAEVFQRGEQPHALYEFEPSAEQVLDALLPRYVESRIYNALLQAAASEHAARRRAMKSATDNAEELIKSLTRLANQARQADITQEISEIVGGANALADATAGSD
ncbi:F0F1 ATP synthase subunit gamma [Streptomyces sp. 7-21]|jgi:F-type H+-transporting ATPase subunit gamma|uniref:F0F1 ATP synthase subunit gamma n=1 Tax=Streptomyces sp. 7-21 TaxID=2802283 RepID=UPI00191D4266|nr:F0F1 ATP synthase subunit gamma [Streptomyces sp. 7-21]MBL1065339.1 F0F1 ATP synthase subunit gamma [Streptomyces sp. 7-21]